MTPRDRPRVLVVTGVAPVPSETFVTEHALGLAERGWSVHLRATRRIDDNPDLSVTADVLDQGLDSFAGLIGRTPSRRQALTAMLRARQPRALWVEPMRLAAHIAGPLAAEIDRLEPDIVHAHFGPVALGAALAVGERGVPLVADLHGHDLTSLPRAHGWGDYRRLLADHRLVVHSRYAADQVQAALGWVPILIGYGTAPAFLPPVRPERWSRPLRLLYAGRLVAAKGPDLALEACIELDRRQPDLHASLTLVGEGPLEPELHDRARSNLPEDRVRFIGSLPHDRVATLMREHEILLVPSRLPEDGWVEAFGRVAAEGVRSAMAVIASDTGGLPEAVGEAGVLVEPDDLDAIVTAVEQLVAHTTPVETARLTKRHDQGRTLSAAVDDHDALARSLLPDR